MSDNFKCTRCLFRTRVFLEPLCSKCKQTESHRLINRACATNNRYQKLMQERKEKTATAENATKVILTLKDQYENGELAQKFFDSNLQLLQLLQSIDPMSKNIVVHGPKLLVDKAKEKYCRNDSAIQIEQLPTTTEKKKTAEAKEDENLINFDEEEVVENELATEQERVKKSLATFVNRKEAEQIDIEKVDTPIQPAVYSDDVMHLMPNRSRISKKRVITDDDAGADQIIEDAIMEIDTDERRKIDEDVINRLARLNRVNRMDIDAVDNEVDEEYGEDEVSQYTQGVMNEWKEELARLRNLKK